MRVLICPELYKTQSVTANGTASDIRYWIDWWLEHDENIHVYVLMPDKSDIPWEAEKMRGTEDRVTLLTAGRRRDGDGGLDTATEGYSDAELRTIEEEVEDNWAYFDVVIDQNSYGRKMMWIFLNETFDTLKATVRPFDLVDYIHDVAAPYKYHAKRYRNEAPIVHDWTIMTYADRVWFKSPLDKKDTNKHMSDMFQFSEVGDVMDKSIVTQSPIDFDSLDESYSDEPSKIHLAGDLTYSKKNVPDILEACEFLYQRYDIETIVTSMKDVPEAVKESDCTSVNVPTSYDEYTDALNEGDIVFAASTEENGNVTFFEQAASGQVFVAWDKPWVYDQVPDDYKLTAPSKKALRKIGAWVVNNWDEAVEENKRMVKHLKSVRSIEEVGTRTLDDLNLMHDARIEEIDPGDWQRDAIQQAVDYVQDEPAKISDIDDASRHFTDSGKRMSEMFHYAYTDMILTLKKLGYEDVGTREPAFQ